MAELTPSTREAARRLGVSDTTMHKTYRNNLQRRCVLHLNNLTFTDIVPNTPPNFTNSPLNHCKFSIVKDTTFSLRTQPRS
jgi:DNA-binding transcriptional regulator YhcF (GntR family)